VRFRSVADISSASACGTRAEEFHGKLVDFLIGYASTPGVSAADRDKAIAAAETTLVSAVGNWRAKQRLADYYFLRGDTQKAHQWYATSARVIDIPGFDATTPEDKKILMARLAASQALITGDQPATGIRDKRIALVVGNGAYRYASPLENPVNDARGMRDVLTKLGFNVVYGEDLEQKALRRKVGQFAAIAKGADVAIVYFAGHGATFGDTPYVVPVDAEFASLDQMPYELVPVETLIGELRQVKGVRIAILDACRDNEAELELKRKAANRGHVTRGLELTKNSDGLILAYATQHLSTAADSVGSDHSPFTAALLRNIATPGVDVKEMFFKVARDVLAATDGRQRPEISVSFYDQYTLAPATGR
jgi:hypothetical protein